MCACYVTTLVWICSTRRSIRTVSHGSSNNCKSLTYFGHCDPACRESYEIGRGKPNMDCVRQARTLRLLANTFLEWDGTTYWQKALSAVGELLMNFHTIILYWACIDQGLANSEHSHALGLLLKTSILLQYDPDNDIISHGKSVQQEICRYMQGFIHHWYNAAFEDTLHHPDLTTDMAITAIKLANQHNRYDISL